MPKLPVIFLITVFAAAACSSRHDKERTIPPTYDTETYCLNGTMIVSLDGKFGLADTCGKEILAPVYDDVYFLNDETAAAFSGQTVGFFDREGNRLGETETDGEASLDELLAAYSRIEKERREQWDRILDSYGELRQYCRSDSASARTAALMAEDIRAALENVSGPMGKDQKLRFETECSAYRQ